MREITEFNKNNPGRRGYKKKKKKKGFDKLVTWSQFKTQKGHFPKPEKLSDAVNYDLCSYSLSEPPHPSTKW